MKVPENSAEANITTAALLQSDPKSLKFEDILLYQNKFRIDLFPMILLSSGITVDTFINFEITSHVNLFSPTNLHFFDTKTNKFHIIPVKKSHVILCDLFTLDEKFYFTKFLKYCLSLLETTSEIEDEDSKYEKFLEENNIGGYLSTFINISVVFDWNSIFVQEQSKSYFLKKLKQTFESLKRFNTSSKYLMSTEGSQDLNHCFLRKACVVGAVTCYGVPIKAISPKDGKCDIVFDEAHHIVAKHVIMDHGYASYLNSKGNQAKQK